MDSDYLERIDGLLKFFDKSLEDLNKMRTQLMKDGKRPTILKIPKCKLLGMNLEFSDVTDLEVHAE